MDDDEINNIIKTLENKEKDCVSFSKKYRQRNQNDLKQYYEGANWAFKFALHVIKEATLSDTKN